VLNRADTVPKTADGQVESSRILITERCSAAKAKSQTMNQIHELLVTAPEPVRDTYRALGSTKPSRHSPAPDPQVLGSTPTW